MKMEQHIKRLLVLVVKIDGELEKMTLDGHIDSLDKYVAFEDFVIATNKLKEAIKHDLGRT